MGQANVATKTQARQISKVDSRISIWQLGVLFQVCRILCAYIKYSYTATNSYICNALWSPISSPCGSHCSQAIARCQVWSQKLNACQLLQSVLRLSSPQSLTGADYRKHRRQASASAIADKPARALSPTSQRERYRGQLQLVWTSLNCYLNFPNLRQPKESHTEV
mgnify:CR=1 FL=1